MLHLVTEHNAKSRVLHVERTDSGIRVSFGDGRLACFPASFLYSHIEDADEVIGSDVVYARYSAPV